MDVSFFFFLIRNLHRMHVRYSAASRKVMTRMTSNSTGMLMFMIFTCSVIKWTIATVGRLFQSNKRDCRK